MLVLSRKKNESIIIEDDISITVMEIRGDKVRLGIQAPEEVTVHRQEVYDAIQRENVSNKGKFDNYLSKRDCNGAYGMLVDQIYNANNQDIDKLSDVMGVSSETISGSLEYNVEHCVK